MSWLDTIFKMTGLMRRNTITPVVQNGETSEMQCDDAGRLLVSTESPNTSWSDCGASSAERVIKPGAGKLYQIFGRNTGASDRFIFIFNVAAGGASRPANGATGELFVPIKVKAGEAFSITLDRARAFTTGLYWAVSSTDASFTYDSAGTFEVSAEYE